MNALTRAAEAVSLGLLQFRQKYLGQGPNFPLSTLDDFMDFVASGGSDGVWSGARVTRQTALRLATAWRCIEVRGLALARLPLITYEIDRETGARNRAYGHYLYPLLRKRVNPYLTAFRFVRMMQNWMDTDGNAYAWLDISGRGQVTKIWPWHPARVEVEFEGAGDEEVPTYYWKNDQGQRVLRKQWFEMLHLRGLCTDGFFGLSPVQEHKQAIGLGLSLQEHGARFFSNAAALRGIMTLKPGAQITKDQLAAAVEEWQKQRAGSVNAHKTAFIPGPWEFQPTTINAKDSAYMEEQQYTVIDICRIYGVPPYKAFDLTRMSYASVEQADLDWRIDTLHPLAANWEAELNNSLLSDREADSIYVEFLVDALMRADVKTRGEYLTKAHGGAPWMKTDEVRGVSNLNPLPDGEGDKLPVTNNAPGSPAIEPAAKD